jgi:hypothetical protein
MRCRNRFRRPCNPGPWVGLGAVALAIVLCTPALAYRPFDGTDAAVADVGELEIELQPAGPLREASQNFVLAPVTVVNLGFAKEWELVLQGQLTTPLSTFDPTSLTDAGVLLKHVLRPGVLQDQSGPSIAAEFGVLLPDSTGPSGVGASFDTIVSQRWGWGTVHFNVQAELTRDHHADVFVSTIVEGPYTWKVRPVAEVFYENEFGQAQTISGLVGLIWQVNDKLSFDVAVRQASLNGHSVSELRAGLTFGVSLWTPDADDHRALVEHQSKRFQ